MKIELFNQRVKNIVDASNFKEPEKVPVGFEGMYWQYRLAGKTLKELTAPGVSKEEHVKRYCTYLDKIEFDYTMNTGGFEAYDAFLALGSNKYPIGSDGSTVQHNQAECVFMDDDEYELLIAEPEYFMNEYWLKRNVPAFKQPKEKAYAMLKEAAKCVSNAASVEEEICKTAIKDYGVVPILGMTAAGPVAQLRASGEFDQTGVEEQYKYGSGFTMFMSTLDMIHDTYRGMMDTFYDLGANRETLDRAIDAVDAMNAKKFSGMPAPKIESNPLPCSGCIVHISPYISREDNIKYWYEPFKKMLLPWAEQGKKIYLKGEGSFAHMMDLFREFPKGSIMIQLDSDDPLKVKKLIGDWQVIVGGFPLAALQLNNMKYCKEIVDKCFEELAPGGGYLFNMDKPLLSPSDGDPEFLADLYGYINEKACRK